MFSHVCLFQHSRTVPLALAMCARCVHCQNVAQRLAFFSCCLFFIRSVVYFIKWLLLHSIYDCRYGFLKRCSSDLPTNRLIKNSTSSQKNIRVGCRIKYFWHVCSDSIKTRSFLQAKSANQVEHKRNKNCLSKDPKIARWEVLT